MRPGDQLLPVNGVNTRLQIMAIIVVAQICCVGLGAYRELGVLVKGPYHISGLQTLGT
jgi:hypothetical protein